MSFASILSTLDEWLFNTPLGQLLEALRGLG